ncbi:poly(rC)-binding protein 3-like isoform X1 [Amphibalanus amphitrite]|uniref:poly(rC)-binding protein 3-like isoform X1 n=1 Tax=Amphibalanus amphitrite TaxID=1232801 RepID=UPI001C904B9C|nr:poly(rC)-binding protein 3-like isoform X1 [Amphibalanus amphitrite]
MMASIDLKSPLPTDGPSVTLTIRLLMQGKEVGSIIGKKGEIVKRFREESGAKINISDGACPERIVTVTGATDAIFKAFTLVCQKFEEAAGLQSGGGGGAPRPPITLRLIVPASQCGSLIGKAGAKIKEIREVTGASIQVASEMLPNSTERAVTVSGTTDAITQCIYHICCVMLESPPKGATIPYRPKAQVGTAASPVLFAGNQNFALPGGFGLPSAGAAADVSTGQLPFLAGAPPAGGHSSPPVIAPHTPLAAHMSPHFLDAKAGHILLPSLPPAFPDPSKSNPLASLLGGLGGAHNAIQTNTSAMTALAALAGSQLRTPPTAGPCTQSHEITVPNELIGCIIGKGGTKIAEIRQISGATIRISNCEEKDRECGNTDRTISITGAPDNVSLAVYLINLRISLETASMGVAGMGFQYISPNHIIKVPIH